MNQQEMFELKNKIITELYTSNKLQEKLVGIMHRHHIPTNAQIEDDIIQFTFQQLLEYNTEKMIEAYQDNPNRVLALGVTIMLRKCILKDKRYNSPKHSLTEYLLFGSSLRGSNISFDNEPNSKELYDHEDIPENEKLDYKEMWDYFYDLLTNKEKILIKKLLKKEKVPNKQKKLLYIKIKMILNNKNLNT